MSYWMGWMIFWLLVLIVYFLWDIRDHIREGRRSNDH